jgi:hypothetical protein
MASIAIGKLAVISLKLIDLFLPLMAFKILVAFDFLLFHDDVSSCGFIYLFLIVLWLNLRASCALQLKPLHQPFICVLGFFPDWVS